MAKEYKVATIEYTADDPDGSVAGLEAMLNDEATDNWELLEFTYNGHAFGNRLVAAFWRWG